MLVKVNVTDLRDNKVHTYEMEDWNTVLTVKEAVRDGILKVPIEQQHMYLGSDLLHESMPIDQVRKAARGKGMLVSPRDTNSKDKHVDVKLYIGKEPIDFEEDQELARTLSAPRNTRQLSVTDKQTGSVYLVQAEPSVTVEQLKRMITKSVGPTLLSGISVNTLLLYNRDAITGYPLDDAALSALFESKKQIYLGFFIRQKAKIDVKVRKACSTKEQFQIEMENHMMVNDLRKEIGKKMTTANIPADALTLTVGNLKITKSSNVSYKGKHGIYANERWLRDLGISGTGTAIVHLPWF